jgi:hypothetical protein
MFARPISVDVSDDRLELDRRRFAQLCATIPLVSVAGCIGADDGDRTDWFATRDGGFLVAQLPFEVRAEAAFDPISVLLPGDDDQNERLRQPQEIDIENLEDPLVSLPVTVGGSIVSSYTLSIAATGAWELLAPDSTSQSTSTAESLLVVNYSIVAFGEFDLEEVDDALRESPAVTEFVREYERVGDLNGYRLYEVAEDEESGESNRNGVVAVDSEALVVSPNRESLVRLTETVAGERSGARDSEALARLTEPASDDDFFVGWSGAGFLRTRQFERILGDSAGETLSELPISLENGVMAALSVDPEDGTLEATTTVQGPEEIRQFAAEQLGNQGTDRSVDVDTEAGSATTSATYDAEQLDIVVGGQERLDQEVIEERVPEGTLEFSYEEPENGEFGRLRVETRSAIDAEELRLVATEAGGEAGLIPPEEGRPIPGDSSVGTLVEPDGDEVIVELVVDGAVGEVTRRSVP